MPLLDASTIVDKSKLVVKLASFVDVYFSLFLLFVSLAQNPKAMKCK